MRAETGRDLVPVKEGVVEDELAKLGLRFHARGGGRGRYVLREAYERDEARNHSALNPISDSRSRCAVHVLPSQEDEEIARHTWALFSKCRS